MPSISAITPSTFDAGRSVTLTGSGFGASQGQVLIGGGWSAVGRRVTEAENAFASYSVDTTQGTAATPAEWFGPYYTNNATADGVLIFAAPTKISPNKAGT